jgi:ankyrin repeat protein
VSDNANYYPLRQRRSDETLRANGRNHALLKAAAEGQTQRVRKLLRDGADVDYADPDDGMTALHHAAMSGFEDVVGEIIAAGADVNAMAFELATPIFIAALKARKNVFHVLVDRRASLDIESVSFGSVAHAACIGGDLSIVEALQARRVALQKMCVVDIVRMAELRLSLDRFPPIENVAHDTWDCLPVHLAARGGSADIVRLLLHAGSSPTAWSHVRYTLRQSRQEVVSDGPLLHAALYSGNEELVSLLLGKIPPDQVMMQTSGQKSPVHILAYHGRDQLIPLLVKNREMLEVTDAQGFTPLAAAIITNNSKCVEALLQKTAEFNADLETASISLFCIAELACEGDLEIKRALLQAGVSLRKHDSQGRSVLHHAAMSGHAQCIQWLLSNGADVDCVDQHHQTPLMYATGNDHPRCVRTLLEAGASINTKDEDGICALMDSAHFGYADCVRALLDHNAPVDAQGRKNSTALMEAADEGHSNCVEALLQAGATVGLRNDYGLEALSLAARRGHGNCLRLLIDHHGNVDTRDNEGVSPLMWSCRNGELESLNILLKSGADANAQHEDGWTALHYAAYKARSEAIKLLLDHGANVNDPTDYDGTPLDILYYRIGNRQRRSECEAILKRFGGKTVAELNAAKRPSESSRSQSSQNTNDKPIRRWYKTTR